VGCRVNRQHRISQPRRAIRALHGIGEAGKFRAEFGLGEEVGGLALGHDDPASGLPLTLVEVRLPSGMQCGVMTGEPLVWRCQEWTIVCTRVAKTVSVPVAIRVPPPMPVNRLSWRHRTDDAERSGWMDLHEEAARTVWRNES